MTRFLLAALATPFAFAAAQPGQSARADVSGAQTFGLEALVPEGASQTLLDSATIRRSSARTLADLLAGRVAGLSVAYTNGSFGSAPKVVMAGTAGSIAPAEPLLYVDGALYWTDDQWLGLTANANRPSLAWGLPVDEIEEVRVVTGATGGALLDFGASRGAVFVRTRRPTAGDVRIHAFAEAVPAWDASEYPANYGRSGTTGTGTTESCTLDQEAAGNCTPIAPLRWNPMSEFKPYRRAVGSRVGVSASGGARSIGYRAAIVHDGARGVAARDELSRTDLALSAQASIAPDLQLAADARYVGLRGQVQGPGAQGPHFFGPLLGPVPADSLVTAFAEGVDAFNAAYVSYPADRVTLGVSARWSPGSWLTLAVRGAADDVTRDNARSEAIDDTTARDDDWHLNRRSYSAGTVAHVRIPLRGEVALNGTAALSWSRATHDDRWTTVVWTNGTAVSGTVVGVSPDVETRGVAFGPRLTFGRGRSLGASVRFEGVQSFGETMTYGPLRSADISWPLAGDGALRRLPGVHQLRFRAAYGESRDDRSRLGAYSKSAFVVGSPTPEPIRADHTIRREVGLDARLLGGVEVSASMWRQATSDGLLDRLTLGGETQLIRDVAWRSEGSSIQLTLPQLRVGPTVWRMSVFSTAVETRLHRMDVAPAGVDPGGAPTRVLYAVEGERTGAVVARPISWNDANGDGILEASEVVLGPDFAVIGSTEPHRIAGVSLSADVGGLLTFGLVLDGKFGHLKNDALEQLRCGRDHCAARYMPGTSLERQAAAIVSRYNGFDPSGYIHDASFVRLREVSVALYLPDALTPPGAGRVRLRLSGSQLVTWTRYPGRDPEVGPWRGALDLGNAYTEQAVVPTVSLRLDFHR